MFFCVSVFSLLLFGGDGQIFRHQKIAVPEVGGDPHLPARGNGGIGEGPYFMGGRPQIHADLARAGSVARDRKIHGPEFADHGGVGRRPVLLKLEETGDDMPIRK